MKNNGDSILHNVDNGHDEEVSDSSEEDEDESRDHQQDIRTVESPSDSNNIVHWDDVMDEQDDSYQLKECMNTTLTDTLKSIVAYLPFGLLKAFLLYYERDNRDNLNALFTLRDPSALHIAVVSYILGMFEKQQRPLMCMQFVTDILLNEDVVKYTHLFVPIEDIIHNMNNMELEMIPAYRQTLYELSRSKANIDEKRFKKDHSCLALFLQVVLWQNKWKSTQFRGKSQSDGFKAISQQCEDLKWQVHMLQRSYSDLLEWTGRNKHTYKTIRFPQFALKCFDIMSISTLKGLLDINCFNAPLSDSYLENSGDLIRWFLFVSTVDSAISRNFDQDDVDRNDMIESHLKSALKHDLTSDNLYFSECTEGDIDGDRGNIMATLLNTKVPVVYHYLTNSNTDLHRHNVSLPRIDILDTLLESTTWDAIPQDSIGRNVDTLLNMTTNICSFVKQYDKKSNCISIDKDNTMLLEECIRNSKPQGIVRKALLLGEGYEVMRCFHVSPVIVSENRHSGEDMRCQAKEIAKACILFLMLCGVRNLVITPSSETYCDTVVITSRARRGYTKKQANLNITFHSEDTQILSEKCLEKVLKAVQKKENVML